MDREAWWATVRGTTKELDVTYWLNNNSKWNHRSFLQFCWKFLYSITQECEHWSWRIFKHKSDLMKGCWNRAGHCGAPGHRNCSWFLGSSLHDLPWVPKGRFKHLILDKEMATHSSILAWKIPWAEEPGGLQSMGLPRVRHEWVSTLQHNLGTGKGGKDKGGAARKPHGEAGSWFHLKGYT